MSSTLAGPKPAADEPSQGDFLRARSVKRDLLNELSVSHAEGRPVTPEDLLVRWPVNPQADEDVASLLFEDFRRREQGGEKPSLDDYERRFPAQRDSLLSRFRQHGVLRSLGVSGDAPAPMSLPDVGDVVFGFRLRHALGSGAFASVFLAEQVELAGRPVVLKVSSADGKEPQTLAQLQHTYIVPIYSFHDHAAAGLRAVCMPYFGGASLSRVLYALFAANTCPTGGDEFVRALQSVQAPTLADLDGASKPGTAAPAAQTPAPLSRLAAGSYVQTVAWVGACLAEGLHHAHQRGILHRDMKPSNVLIGSDGQPMLLDFNLAENVKDLASQVTATLGGTVAYMAPEHLRAMSARDPVLARKVDHRSDVYSLGMVIYEMLVGAKPFDHSASYAPLPAMIEAMAVERSRRAPSVRERRPDVPWGVESILRKCLDPDPATRYQTAEQVADDLHAFLEDRPLRHAPELSWRERGRKWARRHPRATSALAVGAVAAALLTACGFALYGVWSLYDGSQALVREHEQLARHQQFDEDVVQAFCLLNTTSDLRGTDHYRRGLDLCKKNLALFEVLERDDWQRDADWRRLDEDRRTRLAAAIREVLLLHAWATVRAAPADRQALTEALTVLDRAERVEDLPPTPALWEDRAYYLDRLGRKADADAARVKARATPPLTARDHYLLATARIRAEGPTAAGALAALDRAVQLDPRHFWARMQRGACYLERGDTLLAVSDFSEGIRLWPDAPVGYFNRGYALARAGRHAAAAADYTAALERDSQFLLARLNRGLARLELGQHALALGDFDAARKSGHDDAPLHAGRGMALEKLGRPADADAAFAAALDRLAGLEPNARQRVRWAVGFALSARQPEKARAAFEAVLAEVPEHPQALYGMGMLAAAAGRGDEALAFLSRAARAEPMFVEARRYRAVLLARGGQTEMAGYEINACLDREPTSGATLYAAACVGALAAEKAGPAHAHSLAEQALELLERAFTQGYGRDRAGADADLAPLRGTPGFRRLMAKHPQKLAPNGRQ